MFGSDKRDISEQETAAQAQKFAGKVKEDTVSDLVDKEDKITSLFEKAEVLKKYWDDACEVFSLIKDRIGGVYTDTPWPTIASLAGALLYVFSPIDCIPDFIPIAGFVDDASVFGFVIMSANVDLLKYRAWKAKHGDAEEPRNIEAPKVAGLIPAATVVNESAAEDIIDVTVVEPTKNTVRTRSKNKSTTKRSTRTQEEASKIKSSVSEKASCPKSRKLALPAPKASIPVPEDTSTLAKTVPYDKIREIILAAKSRYDSGDIVMPESDKFSRKWNNISEVIREKFHKRVREVDSIALIDCTVFGSATDGCLIDRTGIYMLNGWASSEFNGFIEWNRFVTQGVVCKGGSYGVQICSSPRIGINISGCDLSLEEAMDLFSSIHTAIA